MCFMRILKFLYKCFVNCCKESFKVLYSFCKREEFMSKATPQIDFKRNEENCKKLKQSIENPDEKNIAIAGIFGSGKSSLIKTYQYTYNNKHAIGLLKKLEFSDKNYNDYEQFKNNISRHKVKEVTPSLTISLANFNIVNDKQLKLNGDKNKNFETSKVELEKLNPERAKIRKSFDELNNFREIRQIELGEQEREVNREIEKNLFQQFLFGVKQNRLHDSKIKRVSTRFPYKISALIAFFFTLLFSAVCLFNKFSLLWEFNYIVNKVFISLSAMSGLVLLLLIPLIFKIKSLKVDTIELSALDNDNNSNDSLLNKYTDELIYIFKRSGIKIVYFEDLDRLPNLNIFNKLRELNFILNNSPDIKGKITFIYCVSDSIIADYEERSKFFDNIITVTPFVTSESLKNKISGLLKNIEIENQNASLINQFALDMSKFIVDSRLSVYIEKDFYDLLSKSDKPTLTTEDLIKMYAFSIYKNLYYFDYNKLSKNNACLNYAFQIIRFLKEDEAQGIDEDLVKKEQLLRNRSETQFLSQDLFKIFLKGIFWEKGHNDVNSYNIDIDAEQCIKIESGKSYVMHFTIGYSAIDKHLNYDEIEEYCNATFHNSFNDCISSLELSNEESLNNLRQEVNEMRKQKSKIMNMSIQQFMEENNCDEINNEFLKICLAKGYIEADFFKYYDTQKKSYLLENDGAFVRYNVDNENNTTIQNNFSYPLNEISKVCQNIPSSKFSYSRILNFDLVNYVFETKENINELTNLFNSEDDKVIKFFEDYLKTQTSEKCYTLSRDFGTVYNFIPAFINVIGILDVEKQNIILNILINENELSVLTADNKQRLLTIVNSYANWQGVKINDKTIQNIDSLGEIKLNFVSTLDLLSLKEIVKNNAFVYNYSNLTNIGKQIYGVKDERYCLDSFLDKGNDAIKSNVVKNICELLSIFKEQKFKTQNVELILQSEISLEDKKTFVEKAGFSYVISDLTDKNLLSYIVENMKINLDIKNIFKISEILADEHFTKYFSTNIFNNIVFDSLDEIISNPKFNEFETRVVYPKLLLNENNVEIAKKFSVQNLQLSTLVDKRDDGNVKRLIENGLLEFSAENFNNLCNCYNSYISLIKVAPDNYFSILKENKLQLNGDLLTYLICNLEISDLINYFINNFADKINFWFKDSAGKLYLGDLLYKIENAKIENNDILKRILGLKLESDDFKLQILNIVKENRKLFDNSELAELLCSFDETLNKCKNFNFEISKDSKPYLIVGIELLQEIGYLKINKRYKKWKIS